KSQLLLKKKFTFMENFLQRADEEKDLNVNNNDLQALWDITCIEIDDLEAKFKYLDMIKANNWKKPKPASNMPKTTKKRKPRQTQRNSPVTSQKELVKSVRSVPTGTNTRKDPSIRPKPSLARSSEALSRCPALDRLSGQIETNTINTTVSGPKSSTAIPSEVPTA
ncbi:hypothetical protein CBL_20332, partial [Carabus blaptoides fortunei]